MPRVVIPRNELNAIDLPPVCLVTGATEGVTFVPRTLRWANPWWYAGLVLLCLSPAVGLLYVLALVVIRVLTDQKVLAQLPLTVEGNRLAQRAELLRGIGYVAVVLSGAMGLPLMVALAAGGFADHGSTLAVALLFPASLVGLLAQALTTGRQRIRARSIDRGFVNLVVPSALAATAIAQRTSAWNPDLRGSRSTRRISDPHACSRHPETSAGWICGRCGNFACDACLRRVRPEAMPLCVDCFARRPA